MYQIENAIYSVLIGLPNAWVLLAIAVFILMMDAVHRLFGGRWTWTSDLFPTVQNLGESSGRVAKSNQVKHRAGTDTDFSTTHFSEERSSSSLRWLLFSFQGRLNRRGFCYNYMLVHLIMFILWWLITHFVPTGNKDAFGILFHEILAGSTSCWA